MADAEDVTEDLILKSWDHNFLQPNNQTLGVCLKMGHHGSETSSTEAWVKLIRPTALVASADSHERYKMPRRTKMEEVANWSQIKKLIGPAKKPLMHSCVVWDQDKPMQTLATDDAVCTTLYELKYTDHAKTKFESTGGSWYFRVTDEDGGTLYVDFTGTE